MTATTTAANKHKLVTNDRHMMYFPAMKSDSPAISLPRPPVTVWPFNFAQSVDFRRHRFVDSQHVR